MKNSQSTVVRSLTGQFLGWGDDRKSHRRIRLATANGEQLVKVAKSLRPQVQTWQPGIWLKCLSQERIDLTTGTKKIKIQQFEILPVPHVNQDLPGLPLPDFEPPKGHTTETTTVQICQGSSCRRRGSVQLDRAMEVDLARANLTDQVKIEPVKCLHQCKSAPHVIITSSTNAIGTGKTHYRQVQSIQVLALLAKHVPPVLQSALTGINSIEKLGADV